jgi:hypothetical protein
VRRYLRYLFILFIALDFAVLAFLMRVRTATRTSAVLIDIRNAVFTKFVSQPSELEAPPAELVKDGFLTDSPAERARWKDILNDFTRYRELFQQLDKTTSTVEKAKLITLSFSRNGSPNDANGNAIKVYDKSADLLFKLSTINEPRGLCSDHSQVFDALATVAGLDAMKVTCAHSTCGIYCPELNKWVWIDPEFALLAKKPDGQYMSPLEVRDANLSGTPFDYEFFGTPEHLFSKIDPRSYHMYRPENFCPTFTVEWGSDELTRDKYNHPYLFVPKSIRQLFDILIGVHPTYRTLNDNPPLAAKYARIRLATFAVILLFLIGNLAFPIYCAAGAIWRLLKSDKDESTTDSSRTPPPGEKELNRQLASVND